MSGELWGKCPYLWGTIPRFSPFTPFCMRGGGSMTGQFSHNIDAKGRLFIPASLRKELGQTFHVTVGQDHCLSVYSDESWAAFMAMLLIIWIKLMRMI